MRFAIFEWKDAAASGEWGAFTSFISKRVDLAGGFVLDENDEWIVVASGVDLENKNGNGVMTIPKGMIVQPMLFYGELSSLLEALSAGRDSKIL